MNYTIGQHVKVIAVNPEHNGEHGFGVGEVVVITDIYRTDTYRAQRPRGEREYSNYLHESEIEPVKTEGKYETECPHCGNDMRHERADTTHIYICEGCPNVMFEYVNAEDITSLLVYLKHSGQATEEEASKLQDAIRDTEEEDEDLDFTGLDEVDDEIMDEILIELEEQKQSEEDTQMTQTIERKFIIKFHEDAIILGYTDDTLHGVTNDRCPDLYGDVMEMLSDHGITSYTIHNVSEVVVSNEELAFALIDLVTTDYLEMLSQELCVSRYEVEEALEHFGLEAKELWDKFNEDEYCRLFSDWSDFFEWVHEDLNRDELITMLMDETNGLDEDYYYQFDNETILTINK